MATLPFAGFAKAKAPAKGAAKSPAVAAEAAARSEPALKPEEYPDWVSDLVVSGKTLGELKRTEESVRTLLEVLTPVSSLTNFTTCNTMS